MGDRLACTHGSRRRNRKPEKMYTFTLKVSFLTLATSSRFLRSLSCLQRQGADVGGQSFGALRGAGGPSELGDASRVPGLP